MRESTHPTSDFFGQTATLLAAVELLIQSFDNGGKLLICGNGGSAADCDHIVGELMKNCYSTVSIVADIIVCVLITYH